MAILLVRHGSAGSRKRWKGDDRDRPLDKRGRGQARALVAQLAGYPVGRILTSSYVRCVATVEPLAETLGMAIDTCDDLAEGASVHRTLELLRATASETPVVCTHGDVILGLIGERRKMQKGSVWILEPHGNDFAPAVYLSPPR